MLRKTRISTGIFQRTPRQWPRHGGNGPFSWNMLITFTDAYIPCWLANTIELCTKQTRNRVCAMHPLAVYKMARYSLFLPNKMRTRYVQLTYFMGRRVYCLCDLHTGLRGFCHVGNIIPIWCKLKKKLLHPNPSLKLKDKDRKKYIIRAVFKTVIPINNA